MALQFNGIRIDTTDSTGHRLRKFKWITKTLRIRKEKLIDESFSSQGRPTLAKNTEKSIGLIRNRILDAHGLTNGDTLLRVFHDNDEITGNSAELNQQLPFLDELCERFEQVTGWSIDYSVPNSLEFPSSSTDNSPTIFGELKISDMSEKLPAGQPARHRGYSDRLAETLDAIIRTVQMDREQMLQVDHRLQPVVDLPFDWTSIAGNSGYKQGRFADWSVTGREKVRVFAGAVSAQDQLETSVASATLLSAFEASVCFDQDFSMLARVIPTVLRKACGETATVDSFATIEIDPIVGDFEIDGYDANKCISIVDCLTGTVSRLGERELDGTLFPGQILCFGLDGNGIQRISACLNSQNFETSNCKKILEREFEDESGLFLFRSN